MAEEMNRKDAAQEKLTDRNYVYVRYENDDDDEMDIYDIITLCKKGLLIAKRYIALLLVFSHLYNHSSASRRFRRMCIYALCHVVLTILTEVTANLLDTTPLLVNRLLHLLCCATAIAFLGEMCWYIASITPLQGRSLQVVRIVTILIPLLFLFAAPLFSLHFTQGLVINYPDGAFMHLYFFIGIALCPRAVSAGWAGLRADDIGAGADGGNEGPAEGVPGADAVRGEADGDYADDVLHRRESRWHIPRSCHD